jgi:PAS domain S-box-containing protein
MATATALSGLLNNLNIAIWELDTEYRVVSYNRKAREIYGDDVIGEYCYHAAAGINHICSNCPAREVLEGGKESGRSRHSRINSKGEKISIDHSASPLKDEQGRIIGTVISIVDITDLVNIEDELKKHQNELEKIVAERTLKLKENEAKYRLLFEESQLQTELYRSLLHSSSDGIIVYDTSGLVKYVNPTFTEIFGWTLDELENQRIPFLPESEREESMRLIQNLINDGTPCQAFRTRRLTRNGDLVDISLSASRYADHSGKTAGMLVILSDISKQVVAEKEALKARKLESVGVLAGGIAHDFNNILGAILGNISLARTFTDTDSEIYKILADSEKATLRAKDLTQQLLTFAKGGEPIKKVTELKAIIKDSTEFVLRGSNVKCEFDFAADLKPAKIDAGQISQVIQNIIVNANQAMPAGGAIRIKVENLSINTADQTPLKPGIYSKITISDQGSGIPPEILDKIFDPYFTTKDGNSGLGLAITHSIIGKHNGSISIETETDPERNPGSTFTILLPATDQAAPTDAIDPETNKIEPENITILIMDDEAMISELLEKILQTKGFKTITSVDGQEALDIYRKSLNSDTRIDLAIMDLTVPGGMGGQEAAKKLLQIDPQAKLIVSSGYANDPIMANFKEYGFKAAMSKPFRMQELFSTIEEVLLNC